MPVSEPVSLREQAMLTILENIVQETMEFPKLKPYSGGSYLPPHMVSQAQDALKAYKQEAGTAAPQPASQAEAAQIAPVCTLCRHSVWEKDSSFPQMEDLYCTHPQAISQSGKPLIVCIVERSSQGYFCGPRGLCFAAATNTSEVSA